MECNNKFSNGLRFPSAENEDSKNTFSLNVLVAQQLQNQEIQNQLKELQAVQAEVVKALASVATHNSQRMPMNGALNSTSPEEVGMIGSKQNGQIEVDIDSLLRSKVFRFENCLNGECLGSGFFPDITILFTINRRISSPTVTSIADPHELHHLEQSQPSGQSGIQMVSFPLLIK